MTNKQSQIILNTELFSPYQTLILMVSGGSDSVALLRRMLELQKSGDIAAQIVVFHFNHQLRGRDSDVDEQFVRDLCAKLNVQCVVDSAAVARYAKLHKLSHEAAARTLRYEAVGKYVQSQDWGQTPITPAIVTAHTADDQTETFFMRAITGAGSRALAGMAPAACTPASCEQNSLAQGPRISRLAPCFRESCSPIAGSSNNAVIVRPLLETTKVDLQDYLKSIDQTWREDMTNLDSSSTRSLIRNELIPVIKQINPSLNRTISKNCTILRDEADWLEDYSQQQGKMLTITVGSDPKDTLAQTESQMGSDPNHPLAQMGSDPNGTPAAILFMTSFYADLHIAVRRAIAKMALESMGLNNTDISFEVIEKVADKDNNPESAYTLADKLLFCLHGEYAMLVNTNLFSDNWTTISKKLQGITGISELPSCLQKLRRKQ